MTSVDFDLIPNKPPPGVKIFDEEFDEVEESSGEEEVEPEPIPNISGLGRVTGTPSSLAQEDHVMDTPFPISAIATPSDIDMLGQSQTAQEAEEGSDIDEDDGLFAGGDDEEEESDGMEEVQTQLGAAPSNGVKRKLVEEDDYD